MKRGLLLVAFALNAGAQGGPHMSTPPHAGLGDALSGAPVCSGGMVAAPSHPTATEMLWRQEIAAGDPSFLLSPEPVENIGALRFRIRDYVDCTGDEGCYWTDLDAQTQRALDVLETRVKLHRKGEKLALVLDIDETALTNYCENVREDFGFLPDRYNQWLISPEASMPISGTVRLARLARTLGVTVFFITGRPEAQRAGTERNLRTAGYEGWRHLSLKQPDDAGKSTEEYKSGERAKIVAAGYTIAMNVGDQWNDLEGMPLAEHSVKLPNPFYYLK